MRLSLWLRRLKPLLLASKDRGSTVKLHPLMILTGIFSLGSSNGQLIASYARVGDVDLARQVFDRLSHRGVDAWNAMIIVYSRKDLPLEVVNLYNQMLLEGARPDSSTFTVALKACVSMFDLKLGEEIWWQAIHCGYENDVFVGSSVLNLYAKCGMMDEAMAVFKRITRKDLVCWTTIITGFAQSGQAREAVEVYRQMQKEEMQGDGVVMVGLIQASISLGDSKMGFSIHGYMIRKGFRMDVVIQTSLVDMYAKNGHMELASFVFKMMPHKNVISWSALVSGFAQNGFAENALKLLVEMQNFGCQPDLVSLESALQACAKIGFLKLGRSIHGYILRRLDLDQVSCTAVIDMYSKCGALSCARSLFDRINSKDSVSWNAVIACYGIHGCGKEALSLFLQMTQAGLKPDHATFASLLSALSHSGLVHEGRYWFGLMVREHKIRPSEKHYACMVDLLARAGKVEEACEMINSMATEPGIAIWVALLSGCCNHGNLLIGEMAAKKILELEPDDPGIHTLVSNFFASARMWDKVAGVRKIMKKTQLMKVPGYSAVEVNGKLHAFLMEDKSHHEYEQILQVLRKLDHDMRTFGCVPNYEFALHNLEKVE